MFTGLIAGTGIITAIDTHASQRRLCIRASFPISDLHIGESIAVNGACLSVETGKSGTDNAEFSLFVSAETLHHTTLGELETGATVNLERALASGERLGGHIVTGHVDAVGTIVSMEQEGESKRTVIAYPQQLGPEIVAKGSVTLDGISLTVNTCTNASLSVNIIPETQRATTAKFWRVGRRVNVETDILGKYVRRVLTVREGTGGNTHAITPDFLRENGFIA